MKEKRFREGEIVEIGGQLAVFTGECLCREQPRCAQGNCHGMLVFLHQPHEECSFNMSILPTGFCLPVCQATSFSSWIDSEFRIPKTRLLKVIELERIASVLPGRVLIKQDNGYSLFVVFLSFSGNTIRDSSVLLWEIGRLGPEEVTLPIRLLDTELKLPPRQVKALVNKWNASS